MLLLEKRGVDPPFGRFSDNFASDCWNHCVLPSEAQHGKVSPCATENSKFDFGLNMCAAECNIQLALPSKVFDFHEIQFSPCDQSQMEAVYGSGKIPSQSKVFDNH